TTALVVTKNTTLDTTKGTLGGVASPAFQGSGVFDFASIDVQAGATLTAVGSSPPPLRAKGAATIDGTIALNGGKGDDQTDGAGYTGGWGGTPGPGGFRGGNGADGDAALRPGEAGHGPAGGLGGGTAAKPAAGGGAGFALAGTKG